MMGDLTLLFPWWLAAAALALLAAFLLRETASPDGWARVMARDVLAWLRPSGAARGRINIALVAAALGFAALAQPAIKRGDTTAFRHAEAWLVMVDLSKSMTLDDVRPSRLAVARDTAIAIAAAAGARSVGLMVYAGDAFLAEPFAFDRRQFDSFARALDPDVLPIEGSDAARALSLAASVVSDSGVARARLFMLTDTGGIDTATAGIAAQFAAKGHRLDVVVLADPATQAPVATDLAAATRLAEAGAGQVAASDPLGQVDLASLDLAADGGPLANTALGAAGWQSQAHWLLLLAVPLLLTLLARRMA